MPEFRSGRVLGIDPGATTALAWFDIDDSLVVERARWGGSCTIHASSSKFLNHAERDIDMRNRIRAMVLEVAPALVVIEEPVDGSRAWTRARKGRAEGTGTGFRLGVLYGLALAACGTLVGAPYVVSYPVKSYKGRPGWMAGSHKQAELVVQMSAQAMGASKGAVNAMSDDELMAAGVAIHHLSVLRLERSLRRMPA